MMRWTLTWKMKLKNAANADMADLPIIPPWEISQTGKDTKIMKNECGEVADEVAITIVHELQCKTINKVTLGHESNKSGTSNETDRPIGL